MIDRYGIQALQQQAEGQQFDRKSFRIEPKALADIAVAFANADGDDIVIGIEDDGRITGINGNDIRVKIFDNHYVVESPGILPGMLRIDNIRQMHFSRNPKIVEFKREYKLVKEFGEGVDRMYREMAEAGNPAPEYKQVEFMVKVKQPSALREDDETVEKITCIIKENPTITIKELSLLLSLTRRGVEDQIKSLKAKGIIRRVGPDKGGHWEVIVQKEKGGE